MWRKELGLGIRGLRRRPGFSILVVLMLGGGVGAATALFSVFRTVFLEPLPLPAPEELVLVMETGQFGCCGPASGPDYVDWVVRQRSFAGMAALSPGYSNLTGLDEPRRVHYTRVTPTAFPLLRVEPILGRGLTARDALDGGVVVLSHTLWQSVFGGRRDALGSSLEVDGESWTVVGVMPEGFDVPSPWSPTERHLFYLPFLDEDLQTNRRNHSYPVIARLATGVSMEAAQSDMERIMRELAEEHPATNEGRSSRVFEIHDYLYGELGRQLGLILGAALVVLLIACANVAGLQLARAAGRESELAVRSAMGASRWAVTRLLFAESLVLAALGGVVGIGAAHLGVVALQGLLPSSMPRVETLGIDPPALLFALSMAGVTALVFGMLPAALASRTEIAAAVREGGPSLAPRKERLRDAFIVGQIALGLILANGAAVLVRSYARVQGQEYGFRTDGVITFAVRPDGPRYAEAASREGYLDRTREAVLAVPGVGSAGFVSRLPLDGGTNGNVLVEGRGPRANSNEGPLVEVASVVGDYFEAMGIPRIRGRLLTAADSATDAVGVVINDAMAREVWPGEDPVGKRFSFSDDPPDWMTVVGVVGDARQWGPEEDPLNQIYLPYTRGWATSGYVVARFEGDPAEVVPAVRQAALAVDRTLPPSDIQGMDARLEEALGQRRFYTTLIGLFALAALILAGAGIYGTVSYFVARRRPELGIRMALGAARSGIVRLVIRRGLRLAVWGVGLGLVGVWASTSLIESMVYGVGALEAPILLAGCVLLGGIAVLASALPALRAVRVSPVLALRSE
jgi:putative ABC transport system permease protein